MIRGLGSFGQPVTREFWVVFLLGLAFVWLGIREWNASFGNGHQRRNLEIARSELPRADAIVASDPRFQDVRAGVWPGSGGALGFFGRVEAEADLTKLMRAVAKERFRVPIYWQVKVNSEGPNE